MKTLHRSQSEGRVPTRATRDDLGMLVFAPRRTGSLAPLFHSPVHEVPCTAQMAKDGEKRLQRIAPGFIKERAEEERLRIEKAIKDEHDRTPWKSLKSVSSAVTFSYKFLPPVDASPTRRRPGFGEPGRHTKRRGMNRQRSFGSKVLDEASAALVDMIAGRWSEVRRLFKVCDLSGNGSIDRREWCMALPVALNMVGLMTEPEMLTLFDHFDADGNGELEFHELAVLLRQTARVELDSRLQAGAVAFDRDVTQKVKLRKEARSKPGSNVLNGLVLGENGARDPTDVLDLLGKALAKKFGRISDLFREWDDDGSGEIDKREFCDAMESVGLQATLAERTALFDALDDDGSGSVELVELVKKLRRAARKATRPMRDAGAPLRRVPVKVYR